MAGKNDAPTFVRHFKGHHGNISELSFSPDSKQLASSGHDSCLMLWNLSTMRNSVRFMARKFPMTHVHFSPSGDLMACSQGVYVRLWAPLIRGRWSEMKAHSTTVRSVRFHPDGHHFVTASQDKTIKIWDTSTQKFVRSLTGHTHWVRCARYSSDGSMIVSCSDDKTIRLWDPKSGKVTHTYENKRGVPNYIDCHPSGGYIGSAMAYGVIKIYDSRQHELLQYYSCHNKQINSLSFDPSGLFMISGSDDGAVKVCDLVEGRVVYTIEIGEGITSVAFSTCGRIFACASKDKQVRLWKTQMEKLQVSTSRRLRQSMASNCQDSANIPVQKEPEEQPQEIQDAYSPEDYQEMDKCAEESPEGEEGSGDHRNGVGSKLEQAGTATDIDELKSANEMLKAQCDKLLVENQELATENERLSVENAVLKEKIRLVLGTTSGIS